MKLKPSVAVQRLASQWISPAYIVMVGVPGCGKSTFREKMLEAGFIHSPVYVASTDDIIDREAAKRGISYSDAFHKLNQKAIKREMEEGIEKAILQRHTVIHDQTNMSRKSRSSKLKAVPDSYFKICLNFTVDDRELQRRLDERGRLTGKVIPPFILKSMFNNYDPPIKEEGFNLIIEIDNT